MQKAAAPSARLPGLGLLVLLRLLLSRRRRSGPPWPAPVEFDSPTLSDLERARRGGRVGEGVLVGHRRRLAFAGRVDLDELAGLLGVEHEQTALAEIA